MDNKRLKNPYYSCVSGGGYSLNRFRKAFTLAETLIVLVILGVVAAITIPALVRNQIEAQNRTRIKKAMTVYDTAINKMVVENNLKSNDALYSSNSNDKIAFAPQGNCTRTSEYFKISKTLNDDNGTNCRFCSSDNVCWDISNILKPIIGIGEEGITNENSTNRYRMFAHFGDNGELRVDDVAYEQSHNYLTDDEKEELAATYNFANNKADLSVKENENATSIVKAMKNQCQNNIFKNCYNLLEGNERYIYIYNGNGDLILEGYHILDNDKNLKSVGGPALIYNDSGTKLLQGDAYFDNDGNIISIGWGTLYSDNGELVCDCEGKNSCELIDNTWSGCNN